MSPVEAPIEPISDSEIRGKEPDMAAFRAEIATLIEEGKIPDLFGEVDMNLDELNIRDAVIWQKIKSSGEREVAGLKDDFKGYRDEIGILKNPSRKKFMQLAAGRLQARMTDKRERNN